MAKPVLYYRNNIDTTLTLLECMEETGVENIIFSSSATVYGEENPVGEDPQGIPNNVMPYVAQVAVGRRECLTIFSQDYPTPDGTCRRDYIHVVDLAKGHIKAVDYALQHKGVEIFNLGTGTPYSITEIVNAFESSTGVKINHIY